MRLTIIYNSENTYVKHIYWLKNMSLAKSVHNSETSNRKKMEKIEDLMKDTYYASELHGKQLILSFKQTDKER